MLVEKIKVIIPAYGSIIPAIVSAVMQLYVFNKINIADANVYFMGLAVVVGGTGLLAFNTNYVLMVRFPRIEPGRQNFESQQIYLFRFFTTCIVIAPVLYVMFDATVAACLAIMGISKVTQESVLNYYRADSDQFKLLQYSSFYSGFEVIGLVSVLILYSNGVSVSPWVIMALVTSVSLFLSFGFSEVFSFLRKAKGDYRDFYSVYIRACSPLIFSSVRENLIGSGMIITGGSLLSEARFAEFNILARIYRLGSIIFSGLSNFYSQDIARGKEDIRVFTYIFLFTGIVSYGLYLFINSFSSYLDVSITFDGIYQIGIILGVLIQGYYYIVQVRFVINQNHGQLLVFEITTCVLLGIFYYLADIHLIFLMYSVFLAHLLAFLATTIYRKLI
jgi:hypothetical protein